MDVALVAHGLEQERERLVLDRRRLVGALLGDDLSPDRLDGLLAQIDAALDAIDDGSYGRCSRCGAAITPLRLRALPHATACAPCARIREHA